jgi:hypothetical protein
MSLWALVLLLIGLVSNMIGHGAAGAAVSNDTILLTGLQDFGRCHINRIGEWLWCKVLRIKPTPNWFGNWRIRSSEEERKKNWFYCIKLKDELSKHADKHFENPQTWRHAIITEELELTKKN